MNRIECQKFLVRDVLTEVTKGIGPTWQQYRVVGATRDGIAPAKAAVGKSPERYKPVHPGTVFYNPMRILIGSVATIRKGEPSGITSPDYVVVRAVEDKLDPVYFYYWLRSPYGEQFVRSHARGAVRERLTFARLADAEILLPPLRWQRHFAQAMGLTAVAGEAAQTRLEAAKALAAALLREMFTTFDSGVVEESLGSCCEFLGAHSISTNGDAEVQAVTTACLTEAGFCGGGVKTARMRAGQVPAATLTPGEVLIARSNTPELVGRVSEYKGEPPNVVASDLLIRLRPSAMLRPSFLSAYLTKLYLSGFWRDASGGASGSMKKITRAQLRQLVIPVPALAEQDKFLQTIQGRLATAWDLSQSIVSQTEDLRALPGRMLDQVLSAAAEGV